ncbi:neurotransmitter gated ion channel [Holotrichia oblita]|uniref:Neurotransmitter gated ion channel n=1 Tax=Holotrichia oblita TaxID=644536 RepID=A0ACB9T6N7_HOLOL|nr:neurotransmitter gated ion channel [Holotrichia oblita]
MCRPISQHFSLYFEFPGKPTVVQTNILIRSMGPISELDMEYSMDCYFRQYWQDRRLSFLGPIKSLSLSIKMLERIWRPDTYFYNGKNSYVHTITVPNKLLRISQDGGILYSMRLTIKAKCPMELRSFPMDRQSCPLILGSYAYTSRELIYQWQNEQSVNFVPGMTLSQFDLMSFPYRNFTFTRREGTYFCTQFRRFDLHESLIPTLLEFAGVHYFTKVGSGELPIDEEEWEDVEETEEIFVEVSNSMMLENNYLSTVTRRKNSLVCPKFNDPSLHYDNRKVTLGTEIIQTQHSPVKLTIEKTTQTENKLPKWRQFLYCLQGDDKFRRQRQREAAGNHGLNEHGVRHVNSVSTIDRMARILFPMSFGLLNLCYWLFYVTYQEDFEWGETPLHSLSH